MSTVNRRRNRLHLSPEAAPSSSPSRQSRHRRWLLLLVTGALIVAGGVSVGTVLLDEQFSEQEAASCTVEDSRTHSPRRSILRAKLRSDCGRFRSPTRVTCTSDPATEIALIPGVTYDLIVRGPRIPLLSAPEIASATVSTEQVNDHRMLGPTEVDPSAGEGLQQLQRELLPETLRAFDYEQPAFDARCDPSRRIMTTKGLQVVSPERAVQLLTVPAGITSRDPKLPCEGHGCPRK